MVRTCIYVFLAIAIYFAACLCASAVENSEEEKAAETAVKGVQELANTALKKANENFKRANSILSRVESYIKSAEDTVAEVQELSKDNLKAEAVAAEVMEISKTITDLYPNAKTAAEAAVKSTGEMVTKAETLNTEANIDVVPDSESSNEYTNVHTKVSEVKTKVENFQKEIKEKKTILEPASEKEVDIFDLVELAKVRKYHISVILSVAQIDNVLEKTEIDIAATEQKREEVRNTIEEMREISKNAPEKLSVYVSTVLQNTESSLVTVTKVVDDAKKAQEEMLKIKTLADAALAMFLSAAYTDEVYEEVEKAKRYAEEVANKAPQIANALQSAELSAKKAKSSKQTFMRTLSTGYTQPGRPDSKVTNKPENPVTDETKKLASENADGTNDGKPENPLNDETKNPADKGGITSVDENNDSAITVSFSLLLAWITCAALY